jgi:hypothetical protein
VKPIRAAAFCLIVLLLLVLAAPAASVEAHKQGALIGPQLQPRAIAALAERCWTSPENLVRGVAVELSEALGYTHAYNDNHAQLGDASVKPGMVVLNAETMQPFTVLSKSAEVVVLRDSGGALASYPLEGLVITSRDVGLWQINIPASQIGTKVESDLYVPSNNLSAACTLWRVRGFQPWVGYGTGVYLHDAYMQRALLGVMNMLSAQFVTEANLDGQAPTTRTPFISYSQMRKLYPLPLPVRH